MMSLYLLYDHPRRSSCFFVHSGVGNIDLDPPAEEYNVEGKKCQKRKGS